MVNLLCTCSLNPKLQSRLGAVNDLVNSMQVIEPFQNGSSTGTRIGKQFFGSYDANNWKNIHSTEIKIVDAILYIFWLPCKMRHSVGVSKLTWIFGAVTACFIKIDVIELITKLKNWGMCYVMIYELAHLHYKCRVAKILSWLRWSWSRKCWRNLCHCRT